MKQYGKEKRSVSSHFLLQVAPAAGVCSDRLRKASVCITAHISMHATVLTDAHNPSDTVLSPHRGG